MRRLQETIAEIGGLSEETYEEHRKKKSGIKGPATENDGRK